MRMLKQGRGGKHPPGKGKHPNKGGHKWKKSWQNGNGGSAVGAASTATSQSNIETPIQNPSSNNCPEPPANFTQDLVDAIDFKKLSEKVDFQTYMPRVGFTCPWDGELRPGGKQDLCVKSDHAGTNLSEQPTPLASADDFAEKMLGSSTPLIAAAALLQGLLSSLGSSRAHRPLIPHLLRCGGK